MKANRSSQKDILTSLFFKLLPVQILIVAMGAINSIVDGAVAGRCIDASTVGVIGLYYSMINILSAVGSVLLGGTAVLCGRSMGEGNLDKTRGIFSLNLTVTLIAGAILTAASFVFTDAIAVMLGTSEELHAPLNAYIRGYAVGIIPQLLAQQIASFLQLERQNKRGYTGVAGMIVSNVTLDILLVAVFDLGVTGLALATAISNWIYFLILAPYYLTQRAQLRFRWDLIRWQELWPMVKIGLPGAMLVFCLSMRSLVINRVLLRWSGEAGLSALSAINMVSGIFIAFSIGIGAVVRMLGSIFVGEEDRSSLKRLMRIAFCKALPLSLLVTLAVMLLSTPISLLFFPDKSSEVYRLTHQFFLIYACCIPLIVICQIFTNYLQAMGHNLYVNILSVFDGFFSMVIPALLLAPKLGALGVWLANPIGIILSALLTPVYVCIVWKRLPRSLDEWLLLKPDFGAPEEDRLELNIRSMDEVTQTAVRVQAFCQEHGMAQKPSYFASLCLEEMALNVVAHGFQADNKPHTVETRVVYKNGGVLLRIKDDCIPFDPQERAALLTDEDPTKNIGLRMVSRLADEMTYQNLLGLNVLTIRLQP